MMMRGGPTRKDSIDSPIFARLARAYSPLKTPSPSPSMKEISPLRFCETPPSPANTMSDNDLVRMAKHRFSRASPRANSANTESPTAAYSPQILYHSPQGKKPSLARRHSLSDTSMVTKLEAAYQMLGEREKELTLAAEIGQMLLERNERLQERTNESMEIHEALNESAAEVEDLKTAVEQKDSRLNDLEQENKQLQNKLTKMRTQLDEALDANRKLCEENYALTGQCKKASETVKAGGDLKQRLAAADTTCQTLTAEVDALKEREAELQLALKKSEMNTEDLEKKFRESQTEVGHLLEQVEAAKMASRPEDNIALEVRVRELQIEVARLQESESEKENLSEMCDKLTRANSNYDVQQEETKALLLNAQSEVSRLKQENERLEESLLQGERLVELASFMLNPDNDKDGDVLKNLLSSRGENSSGGETPTTPLDAMVSSSSDHSKFQERMASIIEDLRLRSMKSDETSTITTTLREIFELRKELDEANLQKLNPKHAGVGARGLLQLSNKLLDDIVAKAEVLTKVESHDNGTESALACELLDMLIENAKLRKRLNDYSESFMSVTLEKLEKFRKQYRSKRSASVRENPTNHGADGVRGFLKKFDGWRQGLKRRASASFPLGAISTNVANCK